MSFADLKKNRSTNQIAHLQSQAAKAAGNGGEKSYKDDTLWAPTVDKAGNGYAVIRFLPAPKGEELPWVRYWNHGFKGPTGKWYIENSLTSIGQKDPVAELNSKLWNSGLDTDKELARERKRRLHYVANVLVIADSSVPTNDGKVFRFKFGKKIFDKILDLMQPQFQDEKPVNPFDFWEGADFKLKIRNVEGYRNYDKSEFSAPTPLWSGDETKLEAVYNQLHPLAEFIDPKNYKSYDELSRKLADVLGESGQPLTTAERTQLDESAPAPRRATAEAPVVRVAAPRTEADEESGDEETLSYFAKLAKED